MIPDLFVAGQESRVPSDRPPGEFHQRVTNELVPSASDVTFSILVTGGILPGRQAEVRHESFAAREAGDVPEFHQEDHPGQQPNAGDGPEQ